MEHCDRGERDQESGIERGREGEGNLRDQEREKVQEWFRQQNLIWELNHSLN